MKLNKVAAFTMIAVALLLSACNTVEGLGKDVASVGKTVEDAAR